MPPISVALATAKERYITGLTAFRGDDVQAWIAYFADATLRSARLATQYLHAVRVLCEKWTGHPTITTAVAIEATARSRPQVLLAIDQLVTTGILTAVSRNRRSMAWEAVGLLDLIAQLELARVPTLGER